MTKRLSASASSMVIAYFILFVACVGVYLLTWFVTMNKPNLDVTSWSEFERFLLFLYVFAVTPAIAYRIYIGKSIHNIEG